MNTNDTLINLLENRLYYLLRKCEVKEYNNAEVNVLINTLKTLKKEEIVTPSAHIALHNKQPHVHKIYIPSASSPNRKNAVAVLGIAAAACIISFVFVGINASTLARPDSGFFFWLRKDNAGMTMLTDPDINKTTCDDCQCCVECSCGCTGTTK